ncbi:MAG: 2-hydroxyacid dehydrogenase [Thermoplasmatales archaeon]
MTFPVIDDYKKIGENIVGKNIIWYPDEAEILLVNNDNFPRKNTIKMIQTITAGVDHIDLSTIPKETLVCSNAGAYSISVAEHTFALLLSAAKDIIKRDEEMKKGIFNSSPTRLLYGKTIGIIGYGGIGKRVAKIAKAFDMKVIAIGRSTPDSNVDEYYSMKNIEKLVKASDFVLLSIPLTKFTENLINKKILGIMKKDATLINVARPEIVNREDLFQMLNERNDIMYLSDVWWNEPDVKDTNLKNTILTPHIAGGKSGEVMEIAFIQAFKNIKDFIDGKVPMNIVNREEYKKIERKNTGV